METLLCKNCDNTAEGNFCSNCGQKRHTVRLDWKYIQEEVKYTFLHINKGLLYTSKQLLTRPGAMVKEFIEGKRVQHYKPILFLFVLAGINGLLNHYLGMEKLLSKMAVSPEQKKMPFEMSDFYNLVTNHYAMFELAILPIASFCSWIAFRKWGYNYVENIIINCYGSGLRLIISIMAFPIQFLVRENLMALMAVSSLLGLVTIGSTLWLYLGLYKNHDLGYVILRIALMIGWFLAFYLLAIIGVVVYLAMSGQLQH